MEGGFWRFQFACFGLNVEKLRGVGGWLLGERELFFLAPFRHREKKCREN